MTPQATYTAGSKEIFKIWPNDGNGGEGNLAAHSGGSCQWSISFDNGKTWKVLHSYEGDCPRGAPLNSNIASPNQTYTFDVPPETKSGQALTAWSWIPRTGNRGEYYMNCCSVLIEGTGTSTLDQYPDMYLGELVKGDIKSDMCLSTQGYNLLYPDPGNCVTRGDNGDFKEPHGPGPDGTFKVCKAPGSAGGSGEEQPAYSPEPSPEPSPEYSPMPSGQSSPQTSYTSSKLPSHTEGPVQYIQSPTPSPVASTLPITIDGHKYQCYLKS